MLEHRICRSEFEEKNTGHPKVSVIMRAKTISEKCGIRDDVRAVGNSQTVTRPSSRRVRAGAALASAQ
jgi:hypothetical protein